MLLYCEIPHYVVSVLEEKIHFNNLEGLKLKNLGWNFSFICKVLLGSVCGTLCGVIWHGVCEFVWNPLYWNHGVAPSYPRPCSILLTAFLGCVQSLSLCCHLSSMWISTAAKPVRRWVLKTLENSRSF